MPICSAFLINTSLAPVSSRILCRSLIFIILAKDATVHGIYPPLIVMLRMPGAYDIVTILVELHVKPDGIVWTATETVISHMVAPRVYYFLLCLLRIFHLQSYSLFRVFSYICTQI